MKLKILAGLPLLLLGGMPAMAQSQRIDCYRDLNSYTITCPGFGSFDYSQGNNVNNSNNPYYGNNPNNPNYGNNNDIYSAINNVYYQVLGRNADRSGLYTYKQAMDNGKTLQQIRSELANSAEAEQVINRVYRQILGRNADGDGLRTYKSFLASGGSLDQVRNQLANSDEARNRRRY